MSFLSSSRSRMVGMITNGASGSRTIASSAVVAAGAKGKPAKSPAPKKKAASFNKPRSGPTGGGGGGGGGGNKRAEKVLTFSMAADPPDLGDLPKLHAESYRPNSVGRAVTIPQNVVDKLTSFDLPRKLLKELSEKGGATTVLRGPSVDLARKLDIQKGKSSAEGRFVLAGGSGSGKSTVLLQSVVYALQSGWIVLYVPKTSEWTSSLHPFSYDPISKTFVQPSLSSLLLDQLVAVNSSLLSSIALPASLSLGPDVEVKKGMKLPDFIKAHKATNPVAVLETALGAIAAQKSTPMLIALDEVQSLFDASGYRTSDNAVLQSYDLSVPKLFLEYIKGEKTFASGSIITSLSSLPRPPTPTLASALSLPTTFPLTPYTRLEETHLANAASGLDKIEVPSLSGTEAKGLFELLAAKGRARGGDPSFLSSFIASGGNVGEFSRGLSRSLGTM